MSSPGPDGVACLSPFEIVMGLVVMGVVMAMAGFSVETSSRELGEFCVHAQVWYGEAEDKFYREVPQCRWILK